MKGLLHCFSVSALLRCVPKSTHVGSQKESDSFVCACSRKTYSLEEDPRLLVIGIRACRYGSMFLRRPQWR